MTTPIKINIDKYYYQVYSAYQMSQDRDPTKGHAMYSSLCFFSLFLPRTNPLPMCLVLCLFSFVTFSESRPVAV